MLSSVTAFVINNLFIVAAGGLLAAWLGIRVWRKVESVMASTPSWGSLVFWCVRLVVIVGVLFQVGAWIYGTVNTAVVSAVSSPSAQVAGQSLVDLAAGADSLMSSDFALTDIGASVQSFSLPSVDLPGVDVSGIAATTFTAPDGSTYAVTVPDASAVNVQPTVATVKAGDGEPSNVSVTTAGSYVVARGDSLAAIAKAIYGDSNAWTRLCEANKTVLGGNCNNIRSGMKLTIPAAGAVVTSLVSANEVSPGWGQNLVKASSPVIGPRVQPTVAAPAATTTPEVGPAYDFSQKNFWSQFETAK